MSDKKWPFPDRNQDIDSVSFNVQEGDIVILRPDMTRNKMFAGCLMVVTEPKSWGAQGYVQALGINGEPGGQAYYRANWNEMEHSGGKSLWKVQYSDWLDSYNHPSKIKS